MSIDELKSNVAILPDGEQDELLAMLVRLRQKRDPALAAELNHRLVDGDPSHWVTVDVLREHWEG
jgi:hypothetical protein